MTKLHGLLFLIFLSLFSCKKKNTDFTHAVYCWNTRAYYNYFSEEEEKVIFDNEIKKIYCKLSDVVYDNNYHAKPEHEQDLPFQNTISKYASIVPCMFFTNEVMLKSTKDELLFMATKIADRVNRYNVSEFQIDCDWSEQSKENYFYFAQNLKANLDSSVTLSATIRLYQYKYPEKTGVPPVDRGMLMLYNFNSPKVYDGKNAIFDKSEAEKYIVNKKYTLPLDFAVANFSWFILYDIENTFNAFVNAADAEQIIGQSEKTNDGYVLKNDFSLDNSFIRKGQKLVKHETNALTIKQSCELISGLENSPNYTVSIFDLNDSTLSYLQQDENIFKENRR